MLSWSDLPRLGEPLRRCCGSPLKHSPRAALRDYFVHLPAVKDATQFHQSVVQSHCEAIANPSQRQETIGQIDLGPQFLLALGEKAEQESSHQQKTTTQDDPWRIHVG